MTDQPTESSQGADTAAETPAPTPSASSAPEAPDEHEEREEHPAAVATQVAEPLLDISWIPVQHRPKVVIKADLLPALSLALLLAVFGLPLGWIWSRIAPPERVGMSNTGAILPLVDETYHPWDDVAIYLLMGLAFGLVAGVAVWMLRERRGPTVMIAAVLGAVAAGWLMTKTGVSFAAGDYTTPASLKVGTLFDLAPTLDTSWILLAPPLGVALAYLVLSAWSGSEDLGRRLG